MGGEYAYMEKRVCRGLWNYLGVRGIFLGGEKKRADWARLVKIKPWVIS